MSRLPKSESFTEKSSFATRKVYSRSFRELSGFVSGEPDPGPIPTQHIQLKTNEDKFLTRGKIKEDVYIELYMKICALSMENERLRYKGVKGNGVQGKMTEANIETDKKIESLNKMIDTKDDLINNLNGQIDRFKDKVSKLETQIAEMKTALIEKEFAIARMGDKENQSNSQNSSFKQKALEEKKQLAMTIDGLKNQLDAKNLEHSKELCELRKEINDIKIQDGQKILDLQKTIKNAIQEKTAIQAKMDQLNFERDSEKQSYERKLSLLLNRVKDLEITPQKAKESNSLPSMHQKQNSREMSFDLSAGDFAMELGSPTNPGTVKHSRDSSVKKGRNQSFNIGQSQNIKTEMLENAIAKANHQNTTLNTQVEQLVRENSTLNNQLAISDRELTDLKSSIRLKDLKLKELDNAIGQLKAQISTMGNQHGVEITELAKKYSGANEQLIEKEKDRHNLEAEIDELNKFYAEQLDVTKDLLNVNVSKIDAQKAEIESLKRIIRAKEEIETEIREQFSRAMKSREKEEEVGATAQSLESLAKKLSNELQEKERQLAELKIAQKKERAEYESRIAKVTEQLTKAKNQFALQSEEYEKQILEKDLGLQELTDHRAKLINDLSTIERDSQTKIESLEKNITSLSSAKQSLSSELQAKFAEIEKLTIQLNAERARHSSLETELETTHQQLSHHQSTIIRLNNELAELKYQLDLLSQEKIDLEEVVRKYQSLQEESKGFIEKSSRKNELKQQEIEQRYEREISELRLKISDFESTIAYQMAQLKSYHEKIDQLSSELFKKEGEYQQSLSANNTLSIQIKKLENQLASSQQQVEDLEDIQSISRKNYDEKINNLIEAHSLELQATETDKRRTLAGQTHELARLKEDYQKARLQLLNLQSQIGQTGKLDQDITILRASIAQLQAQKSSLQDTLEDERQKHIETIKQFEEIIQRTSNEHTSRLIEIQQENEGLQTKMKTLQSTLRTIPSSVQFPQSSEFQGQSIGMTQLLDNSGNQGQQLNSDSELTRTGTNMVDVQQMIDKLKEELHENQNEWDYLQNEFADNLASLQNWEKERDELLTENMRLQILGEDKGKQIEALVCRNDQLLFRIFQLSTLNCLLLQKRNESK
jgi:chromosome segregation ATPase